MIKEFSIWNITEKGFSNFESSPDVLQDKFSKVTIF